MSGAVDERAAAGAEAGTPEARPTALVLVSFGGPEGPDDVWPFLENVARGRGIPRDRLELVHQHYLHFGGVSPINAQNRALLAALRPALAAAGLDLPVYWGNRNWRPYLADALAEARADGHRDVLALVTSSYPSESGCRQYRGDLERALAAFDAEDAAPLRVRQLRPAVGWDGDPYGWTARWASCFERPLREALARVAARGVPVEATRVHFTTHSVPQGMADRSGLGGAPGAGGEYVLNHRRACEEVVRQATAAGTAVPAWDLVYQSRSGPPQMPWLEPDINDVIGQDADAGVRAVVVVPIGFVSDHLEVVWDLDSQARETAEGRGLLLERVPTPGTDPGYVELLVDVVRAGLDGAPDGAAWAVDVRRPCRPGCCAAGEGRPGAGRPAHAATGGR